MPRLAGAPVINTYPDYTIERPEIAKKQLSPLPDDSSALEAAEQTGNGPAARQFIRWRETGVFQLRREHKQPAAAAEVSASVGGTALVEVEEEDWVERTAEDAEAMGIEDGSPITARLKRSGAR